MQQNSTRENQKVRIAPGRTTIWKQQPGKNHQVEEAWEQHQPQPTKEASNRYGNIRASLKGRHLDSTSMTPTKAPAISIDGTKSWSNNHWQ
jgi:hypothetical protein